MTSLRERAEGGDNGNNGNANGGGGSEVAHRPVTLADRIEQIEEEFARAMPSGMARQMVQDAVHCTRTIDKLDQCDPRSVLGALMSIAQLGLRPGVNGLAWPLPFWDNRFRWWDASTGNGRWRTGGYRAQLVIGYQGFIHLGYESDRLRDLSARVVREGDEYEIEYAPEPVLRHKPATRGDRSQRPIVAYYAIWRTTTGGLGFFDMTAEEMHQWRDQFAPRGKPARPGEPGPIVGPWAAQRGSNNYTEMALKTCVRRGAKYLPKSSGLATAAAVDGTVRVDTSALLDPSAVSEFPNLEAGNAAPGHVTLQGETVPEGTPEDPAAGVDPPESWTRSE